MKIYGNGERITIVLRDGGVLSIDEDGAIRAPGVLGPSVKTIEGTRYKPVNATALEIGHRIKAKAQHIRDHAGNAGLGVAMGAIVDEIAEIAFTYAKENKE